MLYNLDRYTKQSILAQYKQDALNYRQKRQNERLKRIQEEREYILDVMRRERETDMRLKEEKIKIQNEQMKEYQDLLKKLKYDIPGYHYKSQKKEVINKNWGKSFIESNIQNNKKEINKNENNKFLNSNDNKDKTERKLSPSQKEREYIRKEDNMSNYLTDDNNKKDFEKYLIQQKEKRQKYYREILDTQYQEMLNKNKDLYGTIDPLIVGREKKKNITENPYTKNSQYDFGQSTLSHNPITNPENNIYYNKYLFRNNDRIKYKGISRNENANKNGHFFNNIYSQFKTIDNLKQNLGYDNSKSSINIFRNNPNKISQQSYSYDKSNMKYENIINNDNERDYLNLHSVPTPSGKALRRAGASSVFS